MALHVVHFVRPINEGTCNGLIQACLGAIKQGASELRLHISSTGGSTVYGFTLYHFLKSLPIKVTAHNMGSVESMAILVYLAASTRTAEQRSRFLIHPLTWTVTAAMEMPHRQLREWVASLDNDVQRYVDLFQETTQRAKQPFDIQNALAGNTPAVLEAPAVVEAAIAHELTTTTLPSDAIIWWVNP